MDVVNVDMIKELSPSDYNVEEIEQNMEQIQFQQRAFSELIKSDIIQNSRHEGIKLEYVTKEHGDTIATSKFAICGDISYISWVQVNKQFRNNGIGNRLVEKTIQLIKEYNVEAIYTLPKSSEAETIFKRKFGFKNADKPISNWCVKEL